MHTGIKKTTLLKYTCQLFYKSAIFIFKLHCLRYLKDKHVQTNKNMLIIKYFILKHQITPGNTRILCVFINIKNRNGKTPEEISCRTGMCRCLQNMKPNLKIVL